MISIYRKSIQIKTIYFLYNHKVKKRTRVSNSLEDILKYELIDNENCYVDNFYLMHTFKNKPNIEELQYFFPELFI